MNVRPIDKTKKSNIKCEHCKHYQSVMGQICSGKCVASGKYKNYWNRCKQFEWRDQK